MRPHTALHIATQPHTYTPTHLHPYTPPPQAAASSSLTSAQTFHKAYFYAYQPKTSQWPEEATLSVDTARLTDHTAGRWMVG